mmetsp:Transcript_55118/g.178570  ORF Transcript_55118/g.178570 Transcript_55118/m.178570 type:complete len:332 (+) Transcript_55118:1348-2343(+)
MHAWVALGCEDAGVRAHVGRTGHAHSWHHTLLREHCRPSRMPGRRLGLRGRLGPVLAAAAPLRGPTSAIRFSLLSLFGFLVLVRFSLLLARPPRRRRRRRRRRGLRWRARRPLHLLRPARARGSASLLLLPRRLLARSLGAPRRALLLRAIAPSRGRAALIARGLCLALRDLLPLLLGRALLVTSRHSLFPLFLGCVGRSLVRRHLLPLLFGRARFACRLLLLVPFPLALFSWRALRFARRRLFPPLLSGRRRGARRLAAAAAPFPRPGTVCRLLVAPPAAARHGSSAECLPARAFARKHARACAGARGRGRCAKGRRPRGANLRASPNLP